MSLTRCNICWEKKAKDSFQSLPCTHAFCEQCLQETAKAGPLSAALCPVLTCTESRFVELIVDEVADMGEQKITLGGGSVNVNLLNLEERAKCVCMKGAFWCPNNARLEIANCRHKVCYDCVQEKIEVARMINTRPRCPVLMCANLLTKSEVNNLMWRSSKLTELVRAIAPLFPDKEPVDEPGKDDILVTSSVYGHDSTIKAIIIPTTAVVGDMVTACLQQQKLTKNKMTSSLGIFLRTPISSGRALYDEINLREAGKQLVRELGWPQKIQIVIDVDERLKKNKTRDAKSGSWK